MQRETDAFKLSLIDNTYYLVELKEDVDFGIPDLEQLVRLEREICNQVLPVLIICSNTVVSNSDFVKHLARNENNPLCLADAFVLKSLPQRLLAHFYKVFVKPERPTGFFKKQEDALEWLKQFFVAPEIKGENDASQRFL